jgi:hypothetical protein
MDFQPAQQKSMSVWWHLPQQTALILNDFPPAERQTLTLTYKLTVIYMCVFMLLRSAGESEMTIAQIN